MLARDKILKEASPLSIFFVKSGSAGNKLLFRYPFDENFFNQQQAETSDNLNYLGIYTNLQATTKLALGEQERLQFASIIKENDDALCNMFSVNPNLCGQKFEIKINSVRHVGHPMSLLPTPIVSSTQSTCGVNQANHINTRQGHIHHVNLSLSSYDCLTAPASMPATIPPNNTNNTNNSNNNINSNQGDITSFNIVCALRASASYDIVDSYHDLSKRLAIALSFEERRCSFLSREIKTILAALDERDMANLTNQHDDVHTLNKNNSSSNITSGGQNSISNANNILAGDTNQVYSNNNNYNYNETTDKVESVFSVILKRSNLAKDLRRVFMSLSTTGIVDLKINNWVSVSFCLPQKVHRLKSLTHKSMPAIGTKDIKRCLLFLRPYHGLLLLHEPQELLDTLPIDASPAFIQLIKVTKPDKNLMDLSVDANLTLMQIFCIVSQLIYWAKATVIYPICDSNIYAIHPLASTGIQSKLVHDFRTRFPSSKSLHHYLADFSEGTSLSQLNGPLLNLEEKLNLLSIVTWLLQRRILTQVHKYIFLVVEKASEEISNKTQSTTTGNNKSHLSLKAAYNKTTPLNQSSPNGIEINNSATNGNNHANGFRFSNNNNPQASSIDSSPQMFRESFSESFESSTRRYRTDSFAESQEDSNFGLNSSLSSTPNSNLDYPSPNNGDYANNRYNLSNSATMDNSLGLGHGHVTSGSILSTLQNAGLSQAGAKSVLAVPSSRNSDDLKLLIRLMPYFDGKHHIEDMMFFENLERSQVLILCDKFREILFTCHYEDVAVSQLSPFNK